MPSKNCPTAYLPIKERLVSPLVEIKKTTSHPSPIAWKLSRLRKIVQKQNKY